MKYMNKLTLGIVLAAGLFTACSDKDDVDIPGGLALDKEEIAIGPQGGTEQIAIAASQDWVANTSEPWLMLSPANGVGSVEGTIKVDSTLSNTLRAAPESPSIAFLSALIYDLSLITLRVASLNSIFFALLTRIAPRRPLASPPRLPPFPAIPSQVPLPSLPPSIPLC